MTGKQYVISDIHGCINTFKALLAKIALSTNDKLYLLGDYVDRGPGGIDVLDYIINMKQQGYKVVALRGNHEELKLEWYKSEKKMQAKTPGYIARLEYQEKHYQFLEQLPYYVELEKHILVHAGFDFGTNSIFDDKEAMLWSRDWADEYDAKKTKGKTIIHGHTPNRHSEIERAVENRAPIIPLDNGCIYKFHPSMAKLMCLELNSYTLQWQENIEKQVDGI